MAKKATTETTGTGVALFEEQATKINLPVIPKVMTIGGVEFSEELIKKEVDEVKKIKLSSPDDEKTYELLKEKKQQFVKTRTAPNNFRDKQVRKPMADWLNKLKAQTDAYGAVAQQGEDHCVEQITIFENWKEEQEKKRLEELRIRTEKRKAELVSIGGTYDFTNNTFSFPYNGVVIAVAQIEEWDEDEWSNEMDLLSADYETEKERVAAEEAEKEAEAKRIRDEAEKLNEKRNLLRAKELRLEGFEFDEGLQSWTKNGTTIHVLAINGLSDEEWDAKMAEANEPVSAPESNDNSTETQTPQPKAEIPTQEAGATHEAPAWGSGISQIGSPDTDPLKPVIDGMIGKHESHQTEADGKVVITLEFDKANPSVDFVFGKTFCRIYPQQLETEAQEHLSADRIISKSQEVNGLVALAVKL